MDTKTALGAAGGISLTVVGAVSALALTMGIGSASADQPAPAQPAIEYVDQYGNPVELDQPVAAVAPEILVTTVDPTAEVMASPEAGEVEYAAAEYEEEEYDEHEEEGEYEEYEDDDEYGEDDD